MSSNGKKPNRNTLSVCLIARNEEERLPACLESMMLDGKPIWDELVIGLDDRSDDKTEEIARAWGAKIVKVHWPEDDNLRDFAAARNATEAAASSSYVYVQDADEKLIAGHQAILDIVKEGKLSSVRPVIVFSRDEYGKRLINYPRQDCLHRRGSHRWMGYLHEWTEGPLGDVRTDIEVEHFERPGGDRPHGDTFASLRANFTVGDAVPFQERHVFYLCREHAGAPLMKDSEFSGHEHEAIALAELMMKCSTVASPIQRSHTCILAAEMCSRLGESTRAREWYMRAIQEWAAWAEPYYALGVFCHEIGMKQLEEEAPEEVTRALFNESAGWLLASTVHEAPAYFVDMSIYHVRRYQALAVALSRLGRLGEASIWMQRALASEPENKQLQEQLALIQEALNKKQEVLA